MPVHDWTRVEAGIFHDFHTVWIGNIRTALNNGLLPKGYYALAEQHAGRPITDVLTLHAIPAQVEPLPLPPATGGIAVAERPPQTQRKQVVEPAALTRRRTIAIRHVSGHRLIALVEIVSPSNKDRAQHVADFVAKAVAALDAGVHLLLLDLLPPSTHDPYGMHGAIREGLQGFDEPYDLPEQSPLTLASYVAGPRIDIHLEHLAPGQVLPDMPLFIRPDRYVYVPLEATYQAAYRGMPEFWRDVLEGGSPTLN
jgi:Protein of unknown function (DUF4058)